MVWVLVGHSIIVSLGYGRHVIHAAVTNFQGVPVTNFVQLVVLWEVLVDEFKELSTDVCLHVSAIWRVETGYFTFPLMLLLSVGIHILWCEDEVRLVASVSKCFFVFWFCVVEYFDVAGNGG